MSPKCIRLRSLVATLGSLCAMISAPSSAQRVYVYSEPTVCTPFFKPNEGVTHHAGGEFDVSWYINFPQFGPVDYYGRPDPVISTDRTKKWTEPTANVTCYIDWFRLLPTPAWDADFRWHINDYGGTVSNCKGSTQVAEEPDSGPYDPSGPTGGSSDCSENTEGGGVGGPAGSTCHDEYVYIEISNDGGVTWYVLWEGWATVCQ
jgi:hypothetical protein